MTRSYIRYIQRFLDNSIKSLRVLRSIEFNLESLDGKVLFVSSDSDRWQIRNGKYYSPIIDPMFEVVSNSIACIAASIPYSTHRKSQTYSGYMNINVQKIKYGTDYWDSIFKNYGHPKVIVGIGMGPSLCRAARIRSIPAIEVMHGFGISKDDYAYGYKTRILRSEFEEPSHYIVFDPISYDNFSSLTMGGKVTTKLARHHTVGPQSSGISGCQNDSILGEIRKKAKANSKIVLYTMQHGYDGARKELSGIIPNGLLLDSVIDTINSNPEIFWLLKPHPTQLAHTSWPRNLSFIKKQLKNSNFFIEEIQGIGVTDLVKVANLHVTMSSGSVVEAALSNVASISLCPTLLSGGILSSAFKQEEDAGLLLRADIKQMDLSQLVQHWVNRPAPENEAFKHAGNLTSQTPSVELPAASTIVMEIVNSL